MTRIIIDSGPLVAYVSRRGRRHRWVTERLADCRLFTLDRDFEHDRRNDRQVIPLPRLA